MREKRFLKHYLARNFSLIRKENAKDKNVWLTFTLGAAEDFNRENKIRRSLGICSAPTLAQAQKWLRDEWSIHIDACVFGDYSEDADGKVADKWTFWAFDIYNTESGRQIVDDDEEYDNYESALSAGITAALEILTDQ